MVAIRMPDWVARPPEGWAPVADACERVFRDIQGLTALINARIVQDVAEFGASVSPMTAGDLTWSTSRNISGLLHGIAENRGPGEKELSFRRTVGERSAMRGLPLDALVAAFRIGFLEVWGTLVEETLSSGGRAPNLLLQGGSKIWQWMLSTSSALADGYNTELNRRRALELRATAHFVEELAQSADSNQAGRLASELGFDPSGTFRVIAIAEDSDDRDSVRTLTAELQREGNVIRSVQRGRATMFVGQSLSRAIVDKGLDSLAAAVPAGVGGEHDGLGGAHTSLMQAQAALEVALLHRRPCFFEDEWFAVTTFAHRDSLQTLLENGVAVARKSPHIVEAVRTFINAGFSFARGARQLRLSPNAFRYRLDRWERQTGWSLESRDGILRSLAALELADGIENLGSGANGKKGPRGGQRITRT